MVLRNIYPKNYGPIDDLSYTFRFDETGKPIPLVLIGKNGCGKTLLFSAIIDMMVEAKRKLYPNGILEVVGTNYYKIGNHSYIKVGTNTSSVKIEYGTHLKCIKYVDVMSRNPAESISNREIEDSQIINNKKFKESGFYKNTDLQNFALPEFESSIKLFFPFDRYYKPMWYNPDNYNKTNISAPNNVGYSTTNIIKNDILENIKDWLRTVYLQSQILNLQIPDDEKFPAAVRGRVVPVRQDTKLQGHLKAILSIIKGDGQYDVANPARNHKMLGLNGPSIHCTDISQLSAGETNLYAIAASIIKEWDIFHGNDNIELSEITGCVLIDEADVNLHIDFAYRALPKLMKLFPKIQFILSTHSPFLLAGLKKEYGENIDFLSLPDGTLIHDLNSFSEIIMAYEVFSSETESLIQQVESLRAEYQRIKSLNNKVIIFTEGKTDVKYLKLALQKLQGYKDISSRIEFYDIEHAKNTGDGELAKIFDYLQKGNDTNIKICMFDRDNPTYIFSDTFLRGNNQVYKFNLCTPQHRSKTDLISVEHCLTDSELKTVDANGRRIFLAGEFSKITRITADEQYVCHHKIGSNPLEILDGSNDKKVYKISANDESNYALTKDDFVQHIIDNDPGFDKFSFDGFRPTLDTIKAIIQDAERMNTVS